MVSPFVDGNSEAGGSFKVPPLIGGKAGVPDIPSLPELAVSFRSAFIGHTQLEHLLCMRNHLRDGVGSALWG